MSTAITVAVLGSVVSANAEDIVPYEAYYRYGDVDDDALAIQKYRAGYTTDIGRTDEYFYLP